MTETIETDYLVVGAGAGGMAFTDSILTHTDATVTIVDKRHAPGGHWLEAYPFVRLHQPSAFYGVESVPFGSDQRDQIGTNTGFYELAGADEIRAYYRHVMDRVFLPGGRVTYIPNGEYMADGTVRSRIVNRTWDVDAKRRVVDTTYLEGRFPGSSPPPFEVADGVRLVPAGGVASISDLPESFTIIGAGKTALDVCVWLLEQNVPADRIRWIKPREAWWINRRFQQPFDLVTETYRGSAIQVEAMAQASSIEDLFQRLEDKGFFLRVDQSAPATMFRGAVLGEGELELLRQIENVVRLGHVQRIEKDRIVLDHGEVPTDSQTLHVHCASRGLSWREPKPIFEPGRITLQPFTWVFSSYQFAMLGVVEALLEDDEQRNQLCPAIPFWASNRDYPALFLGSIMHDQVRRQHPAVHEWAKRSRLNPLAGLSRFRDDPSVVGSREAITRHGMEAAMKIQAMLAAEPEASIPEAASQS